MFRVRALRGWGWGEVGRLRRGGRPRGRWMGNGRAARGRREGGGGGADRGGDEGGREMVWPRQRRSKK